MIPKRCSELPSSNKVPKVQKVEKKFLLLNLLMGFRKTTFLLPLESARRTWLNPWCQAAVQSTLAGCLLICLRTLPDQPSLASWSRRVYYHDWFSVSKSFCCPNQARPCAPFHWEQRITPSQSESFQSRNLGTYSCPGWPSGSYQGRDFSPFPQSPQAPRNPVTFRTTLSPEHIPLQEFVLIKSVSVILFHHCHQQQVPYFFELSASTSSGWSKSVFTWLIWCSKTNTFPSWCCYQSEFQNNSQQICWLIFVKKWSKSGWSEVKAWVPKLEVKFKHEIILATTASEL